MERRGALCKAGKMCVLRAVGESFGSEQLVGNCAMCELVMIVPFGRPTWRPDDVFS